ncbi:MAG: cohesin domain-containing protein [Clostridia bacterium]|nr:cohesin domain-containing protein [Clostridia bacterium]
MSKKLFTTLLVTLTVILTLAISAYADSTAPSVPTGLTSNNTTFVSTTLSWNASTDDVRVSGYEIYQNSVYLLTVSSTSFGITGLKPNTTYKYSVLAKDAAGNKSALCAEISVTTPADTIAPTTPQNFSIKVLTSNYLKLAWEPSTDNVGIEGYDVYRNNVFLKTVYSRNYVIDSGLTPLTEYSYYVVAKDIAGNKSAQSVTYKVSTTSTPVGYVTLSLDKEKASVGSIIKASMNISNIPQFGGTILFIKYDPTVVQPVDIFNNNTPYANGSGNTIEGGTILTNSYYNPVQYTTFKTQEGVINFIKMYNRMDLYRQTGVAETSGTLGVIGFKVLKPQPIIIKYSHPGTNFNEGTSLSDWDYDAIPAGGYNVIQPAAVAGFLYGDVDGNEVFDSSDYACMRQYLMGAITDFPSPTGKTAADVDGNGTIDSTDYAYMQQYLLGMITKFPAEV